MNDGGPAFPVAGVVGMHNGQGGMSLRDYFAAKALLGILSDSNFLTHSTKGTKDADEWRGNIAGHAYEYADAMLAAREANLPLQ